MTDDEVTQLYRSLLGRDPESPDTIRAFKGYYASLERGRRALFASDEFDAYFARVTGRALRSKDSLGAALALTLLARAASALPAPASPPPRDETVRAGMQYFFPPGQPARFAIAVGEAPDLALDDLLPLGGPESAILHIAPGFPPVVPLAGTLTDGTTVFRLGGDEASVAGIVQQFGPRIDALALLGRPAGQGWLDALKPHFAQKTLVAIGRTSESFDAAALSAAAGTVLDAEPVQHWRGLSLHHCGGWLLPVGYAPPETWPEPDIEAHPALAIACIVRNEAVCIANMLASTRPIASFTAVLDTGSDDGTLEIARATLDAGGAPYVCETRDHRAFDDDFAAMRNAALALVPDWIEWVLMLDADEELAPEDHAALLALIAGASHEAYALPRYNYPGADKQGLMVSYPDRQVRLLRHTPDGRIGYTGAVHEKVLGVEAGFPPLDAAIMGGARGGPHIHHLVRRFRTAEQEERKQEFYREIARAHAERRASGAT